MRKKNEKEIKNFSENNDKVEEVTDCDNLLIEGSQVKKIINKAFDKNITLLKESVKIKLKLEQLQKEEK